MKNLYLRFVSILSIVALLISCSSDSSSDAPAHQLKSIHMYRYGNLVEKWNFNNSGLLYQITYANGVVRQDFMYDNANNLTRNHLYYIDGSLEQTNEFHYDAQNIITSYNLSPVYYDSAEKKYSFDNALSYGVYINQDMLYKDETFPFVDLGTGVVTVADLSSTNYQDSNLTDISTFGNWSNTELHWQFNSSSNALKQALLPILKAQSILSLEANPSMWINGDFLSDHLVTNQAYSSENPESYQYTYTYNALGQPVTRTTVIFNLGVEDDSFMDRKYYYVGDVIPY